MNNMNIVQRWDLQYCAAHVINNVNYVGGLLKRNNLVNDLYMIDIGANVGKIYDILTTEHHIKPIEVWMFEANTTLATYTTQKYAQLDNVKVYNKAVSNMEGYIALEESSLHHTISNAKDTDVVNLGLSYIDAFSQEKTTEFNIPVIKISNFILSHSELFNKNIFIKIDTENADFYILEDILSIIDRFDYKPLIEFEFNNTNTSTYAEPDKARSLLNNFISKGYTTCLGIDELKGDGFLIPPHFKQYLI